ncbi:MAG: UpxY family transcription antiterminator [Candidatus Limimorpha sp.]
MDKIERESVAWYVMRVTYQRELVASKSLTDLHIEHFVPTTRIAVKNNEGRTIGFKVEPLIHNYIFILSSFNDLFALKHGKMDYLRFIMAKDPVSGLFEPQYVPDKQMNDFIKITKSKGMRVLSPDIDLRKGDKVRVLKGAFEGVEGVYIKMPNGREKRVVVKIEGVSAVATATLKLEDVEKL